ncbi:MAG: 3'-5' exonuclease, partial [Candidatus Micrarchaeota archaeon]
MKAQLIDVDYITKGGQAVIRLVMKRKRFFRVYDYGFEPYFYVGAVDLKKAEKELGEITALEGNREIGVKRIETVKRELFGEEKELLRVFCWHPSHVPLLRERVRGIGTAYEDDIPFARRYMIDKELEPFALVDFEREGKRIVEIRGMESAPVKLNSFCFDIETYNPGGEPNAQKDPAIMISYATSDGESGVLTYKKIKRKFVKFYDGERAMIDGFCSLLKEKDAELILGYNSAQFDLPYLKKRAEVNGTKL